MRSFSTEPVPVDIGPCECPGTPHGDGDIVYLAPALSMAGGMAAQGVIQAAGNDPIKLQELLSMLWIRHGVVDWNLVDEAGDKVELTEANVAQALPFGKGGRLVADRADDLYAEDILAPLVERVAALSKRGSTASSRPATSATNGSTPKRRKRSSTPATGKEPPAA